MTKREIIEETYKFYTEDPRRRAFKIASISHAGHTEEQSQCLYETEDGRKCAVGRCIDEEKLKAKGRTLKTLPNVGTTGLQDVLGSELDSILKDEYLHHDIDFWMYLQGWHDFEENWNSKGLTTLGIKSYERLLSNFGDL